MNSQLIFEHRVAVICPLAPKATVCRSHNTSSVQWMHQKLQSTCRVAKFLVNNIKCVFCLKKTAISNATINKRQFTFLSDPKSRKADTKYLLFFYTTWPMDAMIFVNYYNCNDLPHFRGAYQKRWWKIFNRSCFGIGSSVNH